MGIVKPRNPWWRTRSRVGSESTDRSASADEPLRGEVQRLQKSVETLSILNDLAVAMGTATDPGEAVQKLIDRSMRAVDAEQATVTLLDRGERGPIGTQVRVVLSSIENPHYHVNESLLGWMLLYKKPLVIGDPSRDERFRGLTWDASIRSVMCLPLMLKSELTGILTIYNKKGQAGFSEEDERLMSIIAAQSAQIIDNSRLAQDKNRMEEQLNLAKQIQNNLLPKSPPMLEGYEVAGTSIPALSVGGDYYDFIPAGDGKLAVCLGDVSGKGLPASLLMANVQATLRALTLVDAPMSARMERANTLVFRSTDDERFVTLFYGMLNCSAHELVYCNAGHEPPFLFSKDGSSRRLQSGNLALGILDGMRYREASMRLEEGDVLVVYSDGITDAANASEELFGTDRLAELIAAHRREPADILIARILDGVAAHAGRSPQFDDLTLLVVKRASRVR